MVFDELWNENQITWNLKQSIYKLKNISIIIFLIVFIYLKPYYQNYENNHYQNMNYFCMFALMMSLLKPSAIKRNQIMNYFCQIDELKTSDMMEAK